MKIRFCLLFIIIFAFIPVSSVFAGEKPEVTLRALIDGERFHCSLRRNLGELIELAERLRIETIEAPNGEGVSVDRWWATTAVFNPFRTAINNAQNVYDATAETSFYNNFARNTTFDVSFVLENNTGFASMPLMLTVPDGLEIVGFTYYLQTGFMTGFMPPVQIGTFPPRENPSFENPFTGNVLVGWGRLFDNFYGNGALFNFTFRVRDDAAAGVSDPIMVAFRNAQQHFSMPTDANGNELNITFSGVRESNSPRWEVGRIYIVP
ncbi:MAG: hypothetical protein FWE27_08450 [Defluviitaleaceae bacterium]|nr:hypothetical protein [Defluviitaleaceae bacterium]